MCFLICFNRWTRLTNGGGTTEKRKLGGGGVISKSWIKLLEDFAWSAKTLNSKKGRYWVWSNRSSEMHNSTIQKIICIALHYESTIARVCTKDDCRLWVFNWDLKTYNVSSMFFSWPGVNSMNMARRYDLCEQFKHWTWVTKQNSHVMSSSCCVRSS